MNKLIISTVAIIIGGVIIWSNIPGSVNNNDLTPEALSSIGTKEDPAARDRYEFNMLRHPGTNQIPSGIRRKELQYSQKLPVRKLINSAREEATWQPIGPSNIGGRTRALVIDSRNENTMIAGGVSGGIYKSTDQGENWTRTSDPAQLNSVTAIAQDTRDGRENIWYFSTGELRGNSPRAPGAPYRGDGIFKSTDSGESWSLLTSTSQGDNAIFNDQFQYVWNLATNPTNEQDDEILAAVYGAIMRSLDGGDTWSVALGEDFSQIEDLNETDGPFYTNIALSSSGIYFAAMGSFNDDEFYEDEGIYVSTDGVNWDEISPPTFPPLSNRTVMAINGGDEGIAYFFTDSPNGARLFKLDYAVNGGNFSGSWQDRSSNIPDFPELTIGDFDTQNSYNMAIAIHPNNENIVFLGATNLFRSTTGFATDTQTAWIGGYDRNRNGTEYPAHHPDQHGIVFLPSDGNRMISLSDGGLHLTVNNLDDSVFWRSLNNDFVTTQYYTVHIQKDVTENFITGGLQDNGTLGFLASSGSSWSQLLGGDGAYSYITKDQNYWYISFQSAQIFRFTYNDAMERTSFARVDPVGGGDGQIGYLFINPYVIDPEFEDIMYLSDGDEIWRNDNLSQIPIGSVNPTSVNWNTLRNSRTVIYRGSEITTFLGQISSMELAKGDVDKLYYGTSAGFLFALTDPQDNDAERTNLTTELFPEEAYISSIAAHPQDQDEVLVCFSNYGVVSLFHSTDGGQTFQAVSGNLEENIDGSGNGPSTRWSEIIPLSGGNTAYFVATSTGLYSTTSLNGDNTVWIKESSEAIGAAVVTMLDYRSLDGTLVAATHGNGVFTAQIDDAALFPPIEQPGSDFMVTNVYPNPFDEQTRITFSLPENGPVRVEIFDNTGRMVKTLLNSNQFVGDNQVFWDGTNSVGSPVKKGIYYYRVTFKNQRSSGKIHVDPS